MNVANVLCWQNKWRSANATCFSLKMATEENIWIKSFLSLFGPRVHVVCCAYLFIFLFAHSIRSDIFCVLNSHSSVLRFQFWLVRLPFTWCCVCEQIWYEMKHVAWVWAWSTNYSLVVFFSSFVFNLSCLFSMFRPSIFIWYAAPCVCLGHRSVCNNILKYFLPSLNTAATNHAKQTQTHRQLWSSKHAF